MLGTPVKKLATDLPQSGVSVSTVKRRSSSVVFFYELRIEKEPTMKMFLGGPILAAVLGSVLIVASVQAFAAQEKPQHPASSPVQKCLQLKNRLQCEACLRKLQKTTSGATVKWGLCGGSGI